MKAREIKQKMLKRYEDAIDMYNQNKEHLNTQHGNIRQVERDLKTYFGVDKRHKFDDESDVPF